MSEDSSRKSVSTGNSEAVDVWMAKLEDELRARLPGVEIEFTKLEGISMPETAPTWLSKTMKLTDLPELTRCMGLFVARVEWPPGEALPTFYFERNS